jgi:hypothetical protein
MLPRQQQVAKNGSSANKILRKEDVDSDFDPSAELSGRLVGRVRHSGRIRAKGRKYESLPVAYSMRGFRQTRNSFRMRIEGGGFDRRFMMKLQPVVISHLLVSSIVKSE